ncbi:hypothetical protein ACQX0N_09340 [Clostridium tepidum]
MENLENKQTTEVNTKQQEQEVPQQEVKTFTEKELNKKLQSETDRVRTEYSKKIKQMEEELKELRPKEKTQAELDMEARIKALEDKEKEVTKKERLLKVAETLENNGLNKQLAKYLNVQGVEDLESYITEVKETLNNQLLNNSFKPSNHNSNKEKISKEDFNKMTLLERQKLYETNKELYVKLSK